MTTFAFVFARGGSKGLPGKNIRPLGGIPLLAHSIRVARQVSQIQRIFVSTDDPEIAAVAKSSGADLIHRPAELCTDGAPEWLAWRHAVQTLSRQGLAFDTFISLPATAPLRNAQDVQGCLDLLDETTDVVITVTPSARSPYFNMVTRDAQGGSTLVIGSSGYARRQDVPPVYDMTTVAYVIRPDFICAKDGLFQGRVRSYVVPRNRAVDIDDEWDFATAEAFLGRSTA